MPYLLPLTVADDDLDEVRNTASRYRAVVVTDQSPNDRGEVLVTLKAEQRVSLERAAIDYFMDTDNAKAVAFPKITYTSSPMPGVTR